MEVVGTTTGTSMDGSGKIETYIATIEQTPKVGSNTYLAEISDLVNLPTVRNDFGQNNLTLLNDNDFLNTSSSLMDFLEGDTAARRCLYPLSLS